MKTTRKLSYFLLGMVLSFALQQGFSQGTRWTSTHQTDLAGRLITATAENTFAALSSTGQTPSFNVVALSPTSHTLQILLTGSPTGCAVQLEGSLDNANWENLSGTQNCTSVTMFHVVNRTVAYVRGNLTTLSGGSTPTVQFLYKGVK
ncbi:hypothetical protein LCGC14_2981250 [marine sediment metagenome]|uniref:Uncharacterized protein n=1 Tax=marine sediment metagenome TaxID=412755 RepID=A0A0F8ZXS2_9ZZZZ